MNKLLIIVGCSLLLGSLLPAATAHLTNDAGSTTSLGLALDPDPCRYNAGDGDSEVGDDCSDATNSGVSGVYVGGGGAVGLKAFPLDVPSEELPDPANLECTGQDDCDEDGVIIVGGGQLAPNGFLSANGGLCDLEVLGSGAGDETDPDTGLKDPERAHWLTDEETVDGDDGGADNDNEITALAGGHGLVPDGTFDDGGINAVCHTSIHYGHAGYNTPGCDGNAHAEDWLAGGDVWIATACDWKFIGGIDQTTCIPNTAVFNGILPPDEAVNECILPDVNCRLDSTSCPVFGIECGSRGAADAAVFGRGGAEAGPGVPHVGNAGILTDGCPTDTADAAVFVYSQVEERNIDDGISAVLVAPGGWVDGS